MNRSDRCSTRATSRPIARKNCCFASAVCYLWYDASVMPGRSKTNLALLIRVSRARSQRSLLCGRPTSRRHRGRHEKGGLVVHAGGQRVLGRSTRRQRYGCPRQVRRRNTPRRRRTARDHPLRRPESRPGSASNSSISGRPSKLSITRSAEKPLTWWYSGNPQHRRQFTHVVQRYPIESDPAARSAGSNRRASSNRKHHSGGMKFADPHPFTYPTDDRRPRRTAQLLVEVISPAAKSVAGQ